jgi:rubrerythrin
MISFKQAQDVLDYAKDFHHQLSNYYKTLNDKTDQVRVKMLLDYLTVHEKKLEANIERIEENISGKVLGTWFKYTLCEDLRKELSKMIYKIGDISVEEIIRMAIQLDDCLIRIYKKIAANSDIPEVREIFHNLSELEDHEKRRFVMDSTRMYDM